MVFNPNTDSIAITIPKFKLKKHSDGIFQRYNEPYIVTLAVDETGRANPEIHFNVMPFPKVAKGATVNMLGAGHLCYGPKNPGDFVALAVLVIESDRDMRQLGTELETVVKSKAADLTMKTLLAANPSSTGALSILKELAELVSGFLKDNKDDELFKVSGTFLKGYPVPYHVNRSYEYENDFIKLNLDILPMQDHVGEGPAPNTLTL